MASRLLAEGIDAFMDQWAALPVFAGQAERTSEQAYAHQDKVRRRHAPEALAWAMRVLGLGTMPSYWERLAELRMPAQLITGQFDTKFDEVAQRMCARWPTAVHHRVTGAGHNVAADIGRILVLLHVAGVLVMSLLTQVNLVGAMIHGRKAGFEPADD